MPDALAAAAEVLPKLLTQLCPLLVFCNNKAISIAIHKKKILKGRPVVPHEN
jgi:hypothetical protein